MENLDSLNVQNRYYALDTPFLHVEKQVFLNNLKRVRESIEGKGVLLRPHFKTVRSLEAAHYMLPSKSAPVTVSTLREAEALVEQGYTDILYAVGIVPAKLPRIEALIRKGGRVKVLLDSLEQAKGVVRFCEEQNCTLPVLIEIDCDGHRGGIKECNPELLDIARMLESGSAEFLGILAHAGESYHCFDPASRREAAENEKRKTLAAAERLRSAGIDCKVVSIGSTPTAHSYRDLADITEVRAGVYVFFDLVMAGIGVCDTDDIALSVVATVIGHNKERGCLFIDAGWTALSSDRGTAGQPRDCGYGLVTRTDGRLIDGLQVTSVNQEHGIIQAVGNDSIDLAEFPIGSRLHILPNHACSTASMHTHYHVFDNGKNTYETWTRVQGW